MAQCNNFFVKTGLLISAIYFFNCGSSKTNNSSNNEVIINGYEKQSIDYDFQLPDSVVVNPDDTLSFNYLINNLRSSDGIKYISNNAANLAFNYMFKNSSRIGVVSIRKDTNHNLYLTHLHSYEIGNVFDYWVLRDEINIINTLKILTSKKHAVRVYEEVNRLQSDSIGKGIIKYKEIDITKPFDNYWDAQFKSKSRYVIKNNTFVKI